jgi:hypothetical protein
MTQHLALCLALPCASDILGATTVSRISRPTTDKGNVLSILVKFDPPASAAPTDSIILQASKNHSRKRFWTGISRVSAAVCVNRAIGPNGKTVENRGTRFSAETETPQILVKKIWENCGGERSLESGMRGGVRGPVPTDYG